MSRNWRDRLEKEREWAEEQERRREAQIEHEKAHQTVADRLHELGINPRELHDYLEGLD